jgi:aspartyl aminopeptidase
MLNTTPYGGGLWHTWFDRDLGLAGRVILRSTDGSLRSELFRIDRPIARIPNLAIHLTSGTERDSFAPNLQEHAKAILSMDPMIINSEALVTCSSDVGSRIHPALLALVASSLSESALGDTIVDVEAQLIDVQKPCLGGAAGEFLFSGRLDNLW